MTLSDWINVVTFGAGLCLIFLAVRRVMTGEDPPPWDDTPLVVPAEWCAPGCDGPHVEVSVGPYDWANES